MNGVGGRNGGGGGGPSSRPDTVRSSSEVEGEGAEGHGSGEPLSRTGSETEIPLPAEFVTSRVPLKDPVELGIIAFEEAEALFEKYVFSSRPDLTPFCGFI